MIMEKRMEWQVIVFAMLLVFWTSITAAKDSGRDQDGSGNSGSFNCVNQLAPCLNYLNEKGIRRGGDGDPPESCCEPLKMVIKKKAECLCSLISNEGSAQAEQAGINITQVQQLPALCGQHVNLLSCLQLRQHQDQGSSSNNNNNIPNSAITSIFLCTACRNLLFYMCIANIFVALDTIVT